MRHIHLIDTSNATDNVGDEIIVDSALKILGPLLADAYVSRSSGHDGLGEAGRRLVKTADMALLLGTNALSDKLRLGGNFMWRVGLADLPVLRNKVVLFGVGANRDFRPVSPLQKRFLSHVLSRDHLHAVRDTGGKRIVEAAGRQVANTSCHTLWGDLPLRSIPPGIAPRVVLTLTRHKAHPSDAVMLSTLLGLYPEVWFWPQQPRDLGYLRQLPGAERVQVLPANLAAYDAFLAAGPVDVVGTRLHGTIRGLQHGRRALVVEIDNRAREIGAETGLPTIARADITEHLATRLSGPLVPQLTLPKADIVRFLDQFRPRDPPGSLPEPLPARPAAIHSTPSARSDTEVTHG
jgi:hypothetical protein